MALHRSFLACALGLCSFLTATTSLSASDASTRQEYERLKADVGRDADSQTRLALWCERHGLPNERDKHLARALTFAPNHALARGLMGMTQRDGQWQDVRQVPNKLQGDADLAGKLAQYQAERAKGVETADDHWRLGVWCERNGLTAEAKAHFSNVVLKDPSREPAWKRLGYRKVNGFWQTPEQQDQAKAEAKTQRDADAKWSEKLNDISRWLKSKDGREIAKGRAALEEIHDPRAVPALWRAWVEKSAATHATAIEVLSRIDGPLTTKALVALATTSPSDDARRQAAETLRSRDPREYVPLLIGMLRKPIRYEVRRNVNGPGTAGELYVEGQKYNVQRRYWAPPVQSMDAVAANFTPLDQVRYDANGEMYVFKSIGSEYAPTPLRIEPSRLGNLPNPTAQALLKMGLSPNFTVAPGLNPFAAQPTQTVHMRFQGEFSTFEPGDSEIGRQPALIYGKVISPTTLRMEAQKSALSAQTQLERDIQNIKNANVQIRDFNDRIAAHLKSLTGQNFDADREGWAKWWVVEVNGYRYDSDSKPKPVLTQNIGPSYVPGSQAPIEAHTALFITYASCFVRGTPVRTLTGMKAIETIQSGDQVLSQDTNSGALSYKPVLELIHTPPSRVLRMTFADTSETLGVTGIHRFWKTGHGWVMARDLKVGETVRTLDGVKTISALNWEDIQPVFNLELAEGNTFFAGELGALVHDHGLVAPAPVIFDADASSATLQARKK